jgi:hypothetical protein
MEQSHVMGYMEHPETELIVVYDPDPSRLAYVASRFPELEALLTTDFTHVREARPLLVSIASPEDTHADVFGKLMDAWEPLGIFMEKPLATTISDCDEIVTQCDSHDIVLAVNHQRAWDSDVRRMPPPHRIEFGGPPWRNDVHAFHLAQMLQAKTVMVREREQRGLWVDEKPLWGQARRNVMVNAISDILTCIETNKEPECNGLDARIAVDRTLRFRAQVPRRSREQWHLLGHAGFVSGRREVPQAV